MTVDYIESPFGLVTEVGWGEGGDGELNSKTTGGGALPNAQRQLLSPFPCSDVLNTGPTVPTNTWYKLLFRVTNTQSGWVEGKTVADVLAATWTDPDPEKGLSFTLSDYTPTLRCTASSTSKMYGDGGTVTVGLNTGFARMGRARVFATVYICEYWTNDSLSGWDDADYANWTVGTVRIDWP